MKPHPVCVCVILPDLIHYSSILVCLLQLPALRTLGNIVTGNDDQTQAVLEGGILKHLWSLVKTATKPGIVRVSEH